MVIWAFTAAHLVLFISAFSCSFRQLLVSKHSSNTLPAKTTSRKLLFVQTFCWRGRQERERNVKREEKWPWAAGWKRTSKPKSWLLIYPHVCPSLRQTRGKSLEGIITVERMSVGPLWNMAATRQRGSRELKCFSRPRCPFTNTSLAAPISRAAS